MRPNLLRWQYDAYHDYHADRVNLLIHIVAVPAFVACLGWLVAGVVALRWTHAVTALVGASVAFAVQGIGHTREASPSIPFDGAADAGSRILAEQLITFPRFVLGGGFAAALRRSREQVRRSEPGPGH